MQLSDLVQSLEQRKHAPTELWNPPYCGEIPIQIDQNGDWWYAGSVIQRKRLVQLFASVLVREGDDYFLVTPVEKVKIQVADAPFMVTAWKTIERDQQKIIQLNLNTDETVVLKDPSQIILKDDIPYIDLGQQILAKVHRNVFYQWLEVAEQSVKGSVTEMILHSAGQTFAIGRVNAEK
ncbi:DUF1285 domain-containing protein [Pseudidiomarina aestuarii]|uniref:DUF1285 domain-containing protein n=1 Tax=Pseudidiomarina aestuarii TaxID=624146 RepID=A0A2T4D7K4_9GAMM|nr:DUF1285 domain-containing protein [Pseudidiomarina aestuarii]PTB89732.1 DUF1285 domain-containing protein [Pseudidiomarina aestuarii]